MKTWIIYDPQTMKVVRVVECGESMLRINGVWSNQWRYFPLNEAVNALTQSTSISLSCLRDRVEASVKRNGSDT